MEDVSSHSGVEAVLLEHPGVSEVVVMDQEGDAANSKLAAFVVPDFAALEQVDNHLVDRWKKLYEVTYSTGPAAPSFVGWASSYTRRALPDTEMQEWLAVTVTRIHSLKPRKVLEIGCGVGLLVQHLAPSAVEYVATDISRPAVECLRQWVEARPDLKHVEVLHCAAIDLGEFQPGRFDTVILNSVVQYFPNIEYLQKVLRDAVRLVAPGGRIFVGDIRNLRLLRMFHSAVQLSRAPASTTAGELRRRIAQAIAQEIELVIDPAFFVHLAGISSVDVQLRRGCAENELTRYRYDAILHVGDVRKATGERERMTWPELASLRALLRDRHPPWIRVQSIPNRRLSMDAAALTAVETADVSLTADILREQLAAVECTGVDPEELWVLGEQHGYDTRVRWDGPQSPTNFDLELTDPLGTSAFQPTSDTDQPSEYANSPLENSLGYRFTQELRKYLQGRVPEAMVPSEWTILKHLPRTPDGRLNIQALR